MNTFWNVAPSSLVVLSHYTVQHPRGQVILDYFCDFSQSLRVISCRIKIGHKPSSTFPFVAISSFTINLKIQKLIQRHKINEHSIMQSHDLNFQHTGPYSNVKLL